MNQVLIWLTLYNRFVNSGHQEFRKWLKKQGESDEKFSVEEDEKCVFSEDVRKILRWKTCPDEQMIQSKLSEWTEHKDKAFLQASAMLEKKDKRTVFQDTDTKGFALSILESKTIPSDLLWYLQNEFENMLECDLNCASGNLLFLLWKGSTIEGWAVVDELQKDKKVELECLCARRKRTHSFKVGSYLVNVIRKFVAPRPVYLKSVGSAIGFYRTLGFLPDLDAMESRVDPKSWEKIKSRILLAVIQNQPSELQELQRIFPTIPMVAPALE